MLYEGRKMNLNININSKSIKHNITIMTITISIDIGIENFAVCVFDSLQNVIFWENFSLILQKKMTAKTIDLSTLAQNVKIILDFKILNFLQKHLHHEEEMQILIENQLGPISVRMKLLQGIVTEFFVIRFPNACIHQISSSAKLQNKLIESTKASRKTYRSRKLAGIALCDELIRQSHAGVNLNIKLIEFWNNNRHNHNLADCYLQAKAFFCRPTTTISNKMPPPPLSDVLSAVISSTNVFSADVVTTENAVTCV